MKRKAKLKKYRKMTKAELHYHKSQLVLELAILLSKAKSEEGDSIKENAKVKNFKKDIARINTEMNRRLHEKLPI